MESNEDTTLLSNIVWLLDLAFLTDMTEKLNALNCGLQGEQKTIAVMISAVKAFKSKLNLLCSKRYQKMRLLSESTYLCASAFSDMN